mmetsp:Transcript_28287/g.90105  ORF Transcript_28287/g.90105 Transcript_28287/m.90105 type:complete len:83 (+) Transcript_28287:343-591(+)
MDIDMPVMRGDDAVREYRKWEVVHMAGRPRSIFALTGNVTEEDKQKCLAAGCDEFLTKPCSPETFSRMVRQALLRENVSSAS